MSEKVLGFYEKEAKVRTEVDTYYQIEKENIVPVNLKFESITIEWLEDEVMEMAKGAETHTGNNFAKSGYLLALSNLLCSIRFKAVEEKE